MTIHLSEDREQLLRSLVESGHFASELDAIDEALHLLELRRRTPTEEVLAARQRENLERLCERLDAMPVTTPDDGLTNRDHDRILYGP